MDKKVIVIISGGMDSITQLYYLKKEGYEIKALSINYGQKHKKEITFAEQHCKDLGVEHKIIDLYLSGIETLLGNDSVLMNKDKEVPTGHYEEPQMKQTVVPNRNMIMLSLATAWAISSKYNYVAYGAHAGDHAIYPDCRKEFADVLGQAIKMCDWREIELLRPFVTKTKADIARLGFELNVDFAKTWTCYKGKEVHCGMCATCIERREAFYLAGVQDPTNYDDNATSTEELIKNNWGKNE